MSGFHFSLAILSGTMALVLPQIPPPPRSPPKKSAKNAQIRPQKAKKDQQGSKRAKEGQKGQTTAQKYYNVPESAKKIISL